MTPAQARLWSAQGCTCGNCALFYHWPQRGNTSQCTSRTILFSSLNGQPLHAFPIDSHDGTLLHSSRIWLFDADRSLNVLRSLQAEEIGTFVSSTFPLLFASICCFYDIESNRRTQTSSTPIFSSRLVKGSKIVPRTAICKYLGFPGNTY